MFYSVDRSGLYQTGGTLDLWQQDKVLGRPFWRLPDWFEADDLRTHVAELFPDGLSQHGWQYMVERHDFIRPTNSDALFVNHNMVVELVFEYVRRAVFPSRGSRFQSFFAWESLEMARAFRKEGQALYRVESSSIFRAGPELAHARCPKRNSVPLRASLLVWRAVRHPSVGNTPCPACPRYGAH